MYDHQKSNFQVAAQGVTQSTLPDNPKSVVF